MASPEWAWRRDRAFEAAHPPRCWCCNRKVSLRCPLDLHHLTYEHFGHEPPEDLVLICRICHAAAHHIATNGHTIREATETVRRWRVTRNCPDWIRTFKHPRTPKTRRLIKEQKLARAQAKWAAFKARVAAAKTAP